MAHIAMFAVPAHGHVNPSLAVIAELVRRGHRVTFPTTAHFTDAVASAGAEPLPHDSVFPEPGKAWPYADDDILMAFKSFFDEAVHVLPQVEKLYADDRPDLILYDIGGYPGRVLAHKWNIPIVQLSPTYVGWDGYEEEVAVGVEELVRSVPGGDDYYADFTSWLAGNGIEISYNNFTGRPPRCIALIPKVLQPNADRVPDTITFVGPTLADRAHQGTWEPPNAKPVLLVSLGSAYTDRPEFYRNCVAAFSGLGWHVVLQIGAKVDPAVLGEVPGDVEVHSWVPQLAVLARASAFVTHAGMGGTMEGLYHGVPMIAVPQAADQFQNAERLQELGIGRHIPTEEATPERLREVFLELTSDPEAAARLAAIRAELRDNGGTAKAADIVEGLL
ncbi:macrolide family glycosyltransferase [Herbidospora sp. RD11066]